VIFSRSTWPLLAGALAFGLLLLIGTLATRGRRPHAILNKAAWLALAAVGLAYATGGAAFTAFLLAITCFNYAAATTIERLVHQRKQSPADAGVVLTLAVNVLALIAMKAVGAVPGGAPLLPVGLSYVTFHAISYVVDVYRRRTSGRTSPSQAGVYLLLLPQFVAGPVAYRNATSQLSRRAVGMSDFAYGIRRIVIGVSKRWLISSTCAAAANDIFARPPAELTAAAAWLGALCFTIQIYFSFSGYADMAIGLGRLVGMRLEENFRWPYEAGSIQEFWRRWHIGLAAWFHEYCWPAGRRHASNLIWRDAFVILLCAMWYGTTWGCLVWAVYHVAFFVLERRRIIDVARMPFALRHAYLVLVVMVGWVFLRTATLTDAALFLKAMAGLSTPLRIRPLPVSIELWAAIIAGVIGSAPLARALRRWSVAIDAVTTSALMMLFATAVFLIVCATLLLPRNRYGMDTPDAPV
jgi:alginate O-acetyltransferase complex protein AlgI